jgi:DEAD/DEAH box helicase domain-containing protein
VLSQASAIPCIFLYDNMPGGAGLATQAHALGPALFDQVLRLVEGCSCRAGCPTCLGVARVPASERPPTCPPGQVDDAGPPPGSLLGRMRAAMAVHAPAAPPITAVTTGPGRDPGVRADALELLRALREAAA